MNEKVRALAEWNIQRGIHYTKLGTEAMPQLLTVGDAKSQIAFYLIRNREHRRKLLSAEEKTLFVKILKALRLELKDILFCCINSSAQKNDRLILDSAKGRRFAIFLGHLYQVNRATISTLSDSCTQAIELPSLHDMLKNPSTKAEAWRALRPLLQEQES